jgi:hypothetical protein
VQAVRVATVSATYSFFYPGTLPGINEILKSARILTRRTRRGHGSLYDADKKRINAGLVAIIRRAGIPQMERVFVWFTWHEARLNRDPDNIVGGGMKYVFDALKKKNGAGVIPDDGPKQVLGFSHEFRRSKTPGVHVVLEDRT